MPLATERTTTAQLKADIDAGLTGDKVAHADPGLSPLGTDDEAAGHPATPEQVALARRTEATTSLPPVADTRPGRGVAWLIPVVVAVVAAVVVAAAFLIKAGGG